MFESQIQYLLTILNGADRMGGRWAQALSSLSDTVLERYERNLPKCPYLSRRHIVFCSSKEMQPADGTRYSRIIKKVTYEMKIL